MPRTLTILAAPINAVGHVNAVSGALRPLLERGHRVVFVLEEAFKNKLASKGFVESIYCMPKADDEQNPGESLAKIFHQTKILGDYDVWQKIKNMIEMFHSDRNYQEFEAMNCEIKVAIERYRPDVIYFDGGLLYPAISFSGIPWIFNISANPLCYILDDTNEVPPGCSGFSSSEDCKKFVEFNQLRQKMFFNHKISGLIRQMGYEPYPNDAIYIETQCLTVYAYPNELNYPYVARKDWFMLRVTNLTLSIQTLAPTFLVLKIFISNIFIFMKIFVDRNNKLKYDFAFKSVTFAHQYDYFLRKTNLLVDKINLSFLIFFFLSQRF